MCLCVSHVCVCHVCVPHVYVCLCPICVCVCVWHGSTSSESGTEEGVCDAPPGPTATALFGEPVTADEAAFRLQSAVECVTCPHCGFEKEEYGEQCWNDACSECPVHAWGDRDTRTLKQAGLVPTEVVQQDTGMATHPVGGTGTCCFEGTGTLFIEGSG